MTEEINANQQNDGAAPVPASDPFSLSENDLVSLSPEQRASLDPIINRWKETAQSEISKRDSEIGKYRSYEDKAVALDKLVNYPAFVQWWQSHQKEQSAPRHQDVQNNSVVSSEEWQQAIYEASQGDATRLQSLNAKQMAAWASPLVNEIQSKQQTLDARFEFQNLLAAHPDVKDLDKIGLDPKTGEGTSLLEIGLDWAEKNGKPMEEGYQFAKRLADSIRVTEQQRTMGMIQDKKSAVISPPSNARGGSSSIEVGSTDELIRRSMEAELAGQKDLQFVLKK